MADQPIIIKRVKKGGHGHHGGAWKVAYADFVTAMMAFFLLLWLLNAVSQEQLEGISDYFAPISTTKSTTGGGGLLAGKTVAKRGVFEVDVSPPGATINPPNNAEGEGNEPSKAQSKSQENTAKQAKQREDEQFRKAESQLRKAIETSAQLKLLAKSLLIDNTPEGLRIQVIDQDGLPMFPRGDAKMHLHTAKMLEKIAQVILHTPQDVAIAGHTDATRFSGDTTYTNWELSADRANAARRALIRHGVPEERIARVVGKAATNPLLPHDPEAPGNRRLTIVLLRGTGSQSESVVHTP